jgi:hypothetical protein
MADEKNSRTGRRAAFKTARLTARRIRPRHNACRCRGSAACDMGGGNMQQQWQAAHTVRERNWHRQVGLGVRE